MIQMKNGTKTLKRTTKSQDAIIRPIKEKGNRKSFIYSSMKIVKEAKKKQK